MTETHDVSTFAEDMIALIRSSSEPVDFSRTTRTTRTAVDKPLTDRNNSGTTSETALVRVDLGRTGDAEASRTEKTLKNHRYADVGTTGTSGTSCFTEGENDGAAPPEWHAVLAELERLTCPDWMSHERWDLLLGDAENFLSRWGSTALVLGWTALDLYGVHPVAPAARFDVMGLLFFVQGGSVPLITARSASILRRTGAQLTYRKKPDIADAVLLSKALGANGAAGGSR